MLRAVQFDTGENSLTLRPPFTLKLGLGLQMNAYHRDEAACRPLPQLQDRQALVVHAAIAGHDLFAAQRLQLKHGAAEEDGLATRAPARLELQARRTVLWVEYTRVPVSSLK